MRPYFFTGVGIFGVKPIFIYENVSTNATGQRVKITYFKRQGLSPYLRMNGPHSVTLSAGNLLNLKKKKKKLGTYWKVDQLLRRSSRAAACPMLGAAWRTGGGTAPYEKLHVPCTPRGWLRP